MRLFTNENAIFTIIVIMVIIIKRHPMSSEIRPFLHSKYSEEKSWYFRLWVGARYQDKDNSYMCSANIDQNVHFKLKAAVISVCPVEKWMKE